ncbi:DNA-binding transcriptional regulator, LysR family [Glycomyces sambucus]|uniref:DNA-binding transcriptional regulator, LysR family n=1 Tax=Glycomyces sambucus TaxID=380244 RepID=A0A1G9DG98_9ACTN|nr:LysR family transcriptional regulator [Glycomyces sambucus]SDK62888.1 DNA-binding transcriptional regulator, LysR family [Glycomyces sambucus]
MEWQEIETFLVLCEERHFARTAQRMRLSPARVTQLVQRLERFVGTPLFTRSSRQVDLTETGRHLYEDLEPAYRTIRESLKQAADRAASAAGELRIGFLGPGTAKVLADLMAAFAVDHPAVDARLVLEVEVGDPLKPLREGRVDVVAVHFPIREPDLITGPVVMREAKIIAAPASSPLAAKERFDVEDLADLPIIIAGEAAPPYWREAFLPPVTPGGRRTAIAATADTFQAGLTLIGAGRYFAPVSEQIARYFPRPDVVYRPLDGLDPALLGLVWSAERETEAVRAFARLAESRPVVDTTGEDGA